MSLNIFIVYFSETVRTTQPQGQPSFPDYGPPPYEGPQPGFLPPHVPGEGPMPMPSPMQGATFSPQTSVNVLQVQSFFYFESISLAANSTGNSDYKHFV